MLARLRLQTARVHLGLMLALTFSTGVIDAVGYLGLDKVFTGNMTGNVVILGMAVSGTTDLPVLGPATALAAFMCGAAVGGRALRAVSAGWAAQSTLLFGGVGLLMAGLAVVLLVTGPAPAKPAAIAVTALLAFAMGLQAATARHLAVKDITTVVVTSVITGLAADSRLGAGLGQPWFRRLAALVLIGAGAAVGALALTWHIGLGVAIAAALTLGVTVIGHLAGRTAPDSQP
ncbi:MAG TPA: YoaK family protein [Propionibacteriaceae bacterium]|nr:YoaK family protein [Propionibacteriaceae bacterium]